MRGPRTGIGMSVARDCAAGVLLLSLTACLTGDVTSLSPPPGSKAPGEPGLVAGADDRRQQLPSPAGDPDGSAGRPDAQARADSSAQANRAGQGERPARAGGSRLPDRPSDRPNIVFVLTDDLTTDLLRFMPAVQKMQRSGTRFSRYFVSDPLCCPSRTAILTGQYPHSNGVWGNFGRHGGYRASRAFGAESSTFATELDRAGYRTGMIGKYLNGYRVDRKQMSPVPPGWDEWYVANGGYRQYDYRTNENGEMVAYGSRESDHGTDVMARQATDFISRAAARPAPFMLKVAPFAPHTPATPAERHADAFPGLRAPRGPAFNKANRNPVPWLAKFGRLSGRAIAELDRKYRLRAQSAATLDDMVADIRRTLARTGEKRDTYLVFSSDNGYHMGEHRMPTGKRTAFDTDVRVPLVITGPGVRSGRDVGALTSNIDLAPTFLRMAGVDVPPRVEGRGLDRWLHGKRPASWRNALMVEYLKPAQSWPPRYRAVRTRRHMWVKYLDRNLDYTGHREYYDLRSDPFERVNAERSLSKQRRNTFSRWLRGLANCAGGQSCRDADTVR